MICTAVNETSTAAYSVPVQIRYITIWYRASYVYKYVLTTVQQCYVVHRYI